MTDLNCFLAGMIRLLMPILLVIIWHKKTGARILPSLAALIACFPAFITAGVIRSGFDHSDITLFYIKQGILYSIFEECTKFLVLRYLLTSCDDCKDAVAYGIGHSAFEEIGAGFACLELIGTGRAAHDILFWNLLSALSGTLFVVSLTVIIFYGIHNGKDGVMLLTAVIFHAVGNAVTGLFSFSEAIVTVFNTILIAVECFIAYHCWKNMQQSYAGTQR